MSATDSDNSIDWLASDNEEDDESERREPDCTGRPELTEEGASSSPPPGSTPPSCPPLGPPSGGWLLRRQLEDDGGRDCSDVSKKASSRGAPLPSRYTGTTQDDDARGLCNTQQGERSNGRNTTQHALKRSRSPAAGQRNDRILLISTESEKDHVFTHKCMELQCYIHPLSLILNGLRSGRYRERLSSFQESVAMDRIQRIMGVLQKPCMGEKYVNIILKMEDMLKSWFPNVKPRDQHANTPTQTAEDSTPSKKPKLSPVTTALPSAAASPVQASILPVTKAKTLRVTDLTPPGASSASNLKWLHTSPICSPMSAEQVQAGPRHHLLPPRDRALTQDSAVSSTTDSSSRAKTDSMVVPRGGPPPLGKINAPCLERLLKSTESIITRKGTAGDTMDNNSWS